MTDLNVKQFAEKIRLLNERIAELEAQWAVSVVNTKSIYQFLSGATAQAMTLNDVAIGGDSILTDPTFDDGGTGITFNYGTNPAIIRKVENLDKLAFSGDIEVVTGIFGATTVKVGDQTIGEDGELIITDATTPGIKIKDTGDSGDDALGHVSFYDSLDALIGDMYITTSELRFTSAGHLRLNPAAGKYIEMGKGWHITGTAYVDGVKDEDNMASDSALMLATQQSIKAYCDAANMIGSGNAAWLPCIPTGREDWHYWIDDGIAMMAGDPVYASAYLPLPTNRGGLKLYLAESRINIKQGTEDDDQVEQVLIWGMNETGPNILDVQTTNMFADTTNYDDNFVDEDCSTYDAIVVRIKCDTSAEAALRVGGIYLKCYYAA